MRGAEDAGAAEAVPSTIGEVFTKQVRLSTDGIRAFALSVDDRNPLHHDVGTARAAGYPGLIASGTQLGSLLMAMTATHFSRPCEGGRVRSGLGIGFDIRFRAVVLADEDIDMRWTVTHVERKDRLDGWIVRLEGEAGSVRGVLMNGTGTLLIRWAPALIPPAVSR